MIWSWICLSYVEIEGDQSNFEAETSEKVCFVVIAIVSEERVVVVGVRNGIDVCRLLGFFFTETFLPNSKNRVYITTGFKDIAVQRKLHLAHS